jgi:hypothetical protein
MTGHFRRFHISFDGSAGLGGKDANRYAIAVRGAQGCTLAEFSAYTLKDAFRLLRTLRQKFPARAMSLTRIQHGGLWVNPHPKPLSAVPDYRFSRLFSVWQRRSRLRGRGWYESPIPPYDLEVWLTTTTV